MLDDILRIFFQVLEWEEWGRHLHCRTLSIHKLFAQLGFVPQTKKAKVLLVQYFIYCTRGMSQCCGQRPTAKMPTNTNANFTEWWAWGQVILGTNLGLYCVMLMLQPFQLFLLSEKETGQPVSFRKWENSNSNRALDFLIYYDWLSVQVRRREPPKSLEHSILSDSGVSELSHQLERGGTLYLGTSMQIHHCLSPMIALGRVVQMKEQCHSNSSF